MKRVLFALCGLLFAGCPEKAPEKNITPEQPPPEPGGQAPSPRTEAAPLSDKVLAVDERPVRAPGVPVSLTASDGSGLRIVSYQARAVVEDPLAFTELHLVFRNPQQRQIEGQFEITLPQGATISRFAMRQPQGWQEGEVVELQAAREAYEDFLHRRQDPALLEKSSGNQFHARVFPIPPGGDKELIVSYSQERTRTADPYRIYLKGLPQLDNLDLRVLVGKSEVKGGGSSLGGTTVSHQSVEVRKTAFVPDADFEVPVPAPENGQRLGLRHDNLVVARITPVTEARPDPIESLLVLFDTSASRALGFREQVGQLSSLIAAVRKEAGDKLPLRVLCFDQDVEEVFAGAASDFGGKQIEQILSRRALGASNLEKALRHIVAGQGKAYARVLLMTDGVATAGKIEGNDLRKAVASLGASGVKRLDAIATGGIRDEALLKRLVTAGLQGDGVVADGELSAAAIARKLLAATLSGIKVAVPGSKWVWPAELSGLQPGDEVLVYADLPREQPFDVLLEGARSNSQPGKQAVALAQVERPLLERAWVNARILKLMHQRDTLAADDNDLREALKHQIIELSTKFRVLSDFTALLILETEEDYARFHIDRRALTDILTVGANGIDVINRRTPAYQVPVAQQIAPPQDIPAEPAKEEAKTDRAAGGDQGGAPAQPMRNGAVATHGKNKADDARMALKAPATGGPVAPSPAAIAAPAPPPPPAAEAPAAPASPALQAAAPARRPSAEKKAISRGAPGDSMMDLDGLLEQERPRPSRPARVLSPEPQARVSAISAPPPQMNEVNPYEGKLLIVMDLLKQKKRDAAWQAAQKWRDEDPGDVLALIALGEVMEAQGRKKEAARAYGSLLDLFPGRADVRRFTGERLDRLGDEGLEMAIDTYRQARAQRPDHPASHRLLAFALLRAGKPEEAFDVIVEGARRDYPPGRFAGVFRILHEDIGLVAAAWIRKEPQKKEQIVGRTTAEGAQLPAGPSLRFVLNWETDANDVDFHISDSKGGHAYYGSRLLPSGGELYADVTTGYGPECFTIEGTPRAYPYKLQAHYYSRGPMGYGMGKLEIIEHDGQGNLRFAERPFVIMVDNAYVDMGRVTGPLPATR